MSEQAPVPVKGDDEDTDPDRKPGPGKTVRHSTGRVGVVTGVTTESVDGHDLTRYTVKRTDGVTGSQIWHASNCTIVEDGAKPEPQPASIPSKVAEPEPRKQQAIVIDNMQED